MTNKERQRKAYNRLAQEKIDFLCSHSRQANTTVTTRTFRTMLLQSDGYVMYNGTRYEIKGKSLGAGVYRVSLEEA